MQTSNSSNSEHRRLVLCFDGTGNKFQGNESDTNIVKLFQMMDRSDPNQFHYYQPGIGTYSEGDHSKPQSYFAGLKSNISAAVDQAVGTSFVDHVVAGYRFLMRYYQARDAIYIFGFSRGAYTARFLSEMVHTIGLLSQGNEEMIQFAWETFSEFQQSRGDSSKSEKTQEQEQFMVRFKQTFCRQNVRIHFLGLFDCVNSVGQFEVPLSQKSFTYIPRSSADHVRHAVSIHERRLKFKPALFRMDNKDLSNDTVEMWFAGNHADVGGGWDLQGNQKYLLSDTPLLWMVEELQKLPHTPQKISLRYTTIRKADSIPRPKIEQAFATQIGPRDDNRTLEPHDMLAFGKGTAWLGVLFWWILEILPIFNRLELEKGRWVPRHWPPNLGAPRDIPHGAEIHPSVYSLHRAGVLKDDQLPQTGGDNPHISPLRVSFAWSAKEQTQKAEASSFSGLSKPILGLDRVIPSKFGKSLKESQMSVSEILSDAISKGSAQT
ncbi:sporulation associated protein [Rhexocercosporidium sp. MPI-PUGE-AT-0058]|nr:sporulation associated protein [Rhexocercosporidium sp. MPI-PUGE-AT-0058]